MNLVKQYGGRSIDTLEKIQAIAKKTAAPMSMNFRRGESTGMS